MDSATGYIYFISQTASVRPLGVAHFYDAFSIGHELDLRTDALRAFALPETAISSDLSVASEWATQILPAVGQAYAVPAEEADNASVVSVASSGASGRADNTDSDAFQPSDGNDSAVVVDLVTDEDESDAESEEDFELSERNSNFFMRPMKSTQTPESGGCSNASTPHLTSGPSLRMPREVYQFTRQLATHANHDPA